MKMTSAALLLWTFAVGTAVPALAAPSDSTVHYESLTHLMLVDVRINGSEEHYNFVIDTGGATFIDKKTADTLDLKQQAMMAKIDRLEMGDFAIDKVFCFTTFDFGQFDALGTPIHGIIGSNLLERYRVSFDFKERSVTFSTDTTALKKPGRGLLLPFRNHPVNNAPLVGFTIGGRSLEGMIDTGQPNPLVLPLETFEDFADLCLPGHILSDGLMEEWPMTDADHNLLVRLDSLGFKHMEFDSVICLFAELPPMLSMPLIGTDLLSLFKMVIDYPRDEILMVPYDDAGPETNRFTIGLRPDISDRGDITVKGVWRTSPAARAGLKPGDIIVSFDSRKVVPSNLIELIRVLEDGAVGTVSLEIADGDTTRTIIVDKALLF